MKKKNSQELKATPLVKVLALLGFCFSLLIIYLIQIL
ncbi:hypothetical protein JOC62_001654 [Clostridium sardiniense]|nr:hypothetical protein [Clostridium sardiniense]MDQ0459717.1 hypothetical protein [Clostridium sardiniense]